MNTVYRLCFSSRDIKFKVVRIKGGKCEKEAADSANCDVTSMSIDLLYIKMCYDQAIIYRNF